MELTAFAVAYSRIHRTKYLWANNVAPAHSWMMSVFFASVGFRVPASSKERERERWKKRVRERVLTFKR